jgi:hypothetical protein
MLGDGRGSWQSAHGNRLINPGQVGIGVAGGTNYQGVVERNLWCAGYRDNVGIYARNQSGGHCGPVWIGSNSIDFTNSTGLTNPVWHGGN